MIIELSEQIRTHLGFRDFVISGTANGIAVGDGATWGENPVPVGPAYDGPHFLQYGFLHQCQYGRHLCFPPTKTVN